jgi:SAM-dependent methyltransferase
MNKKSTIQEIYNRLADTEYDKNSNAYFADRRSKILAEYAKGLILEVGAGTGLVTEKLREKGKVVAVDLSINMLRILKTKYPNVIAIAADAEQLPFKDNLFDSVIASECIYYFEDPEKFIKDLKKMIKDSGIIAISSFSKMWTPLQKLRIFLDHFGFRPGACDGFPVGMYRNTIIKMLKKKGFSGIEAISFIFFPSFGFHPINRLLERSLLTRFAMSNVIIGKLCCPRGSS